MTSPMTLFEVSWEVANKVGGIHTVLSSKATTAVAEYGDEYILIGPWLLSEEGEEKAPFDDDPAYADFCDSCRQMGLPVRVGRWRVAGRPRCILVEFSSLYEQRDDILARLWEDYGVDSISGEWDYVEPVLFGYAVGRVIEEWWERYLAPFHRRAIVHSHEWMTASSLLYLKKRIPAVGTVFTTHATMLGRALSSLGHSPEDGLGDETAGGLAKTHGVEAKHSLEGVAARESDVFTTVSTITAKEAELLHQRKPDPVLPNGIDLTVAGELAGSDREAVRQKLFEFASTFVGSDVSDAALLCISGRYEFHNKGIDAFLDALAICNGQAGRPIVAYVLVPAGNSGIRSEVLERVEAGVGAESEPIGITTHNLFDEDTDPVREHCARVGLDNAKDDRVKVVQVPVYLEGEDGLFDRRYESLLAAMDLSVFPSFYEPWGYTPQESLAVGVPTITSDYAGFGRWARSESITPQSGVTVLDRVGKKYEEVSEELADVLEQRIIDAQTKDWRDVCRETGARTAWSDLFENYKKAYSSASSAIQSRLIAGVPLTRRPRAESGHDDSPSSQKPRLRTFDVAPSLPEELRPLERLSRNLWWCWDCDAPTLFEELSPSAWAETAHNPVAFLRKVNPEELQAKAADADYLDRLGKVSARFTAYLEERNESFSIEDDLGSSLSARHPVAYFCAEFGMHESVPIYSGGLGILAGDHLKSASDLNIPLIGVGLFYRMGYMGQRLTSEGQQIAVDRENDPNELPIELVRDRDGQPLEVVITLPGRDLYLRAWRLHVGRVQLFLLDANTPSNREEDREITRNLYGGDHEMRIRQLIALGRGGVRLLSRLGIEPACYHMNEGHAAFSSLERVARLVRKQGLTFSAAREVVRRTTAFTTHTPVPAGHDRFSEDLVRRYFSDADEWVGVPWEKFIRLGRADSGEPDFNMTYLALSFAEYCNGVSKLHGIASRELLHPYWPGLLESEVPVTSVTNGIHLPTWVSPHIQALVGGSAPEDFSENSEKIDPAKLWAARRQLKSQLAHVARTRLERASLERNDHPDLLRKTVDGLDENALWVGFARRFAPYKRAHLLYQDLERLQKICDDEDRPLRIIVAGKAHPRDEAGQDILKGIAEHTRGDLVGRVILVEDYDIDLGRALVQGVDVWLNNPTRMLEASGTSGMKAAANGVLNLSISDGWWPEGADGENGWTIAEERVYDDPVLQDQFDAGALYALLEDELLPMYFDRDADGVPQEWMRRVIHDLKTLPVVFNTDRMVQEYFDTAYRPRAERFFALQADDLEDAKRCASEMKRIRREFRDVEIVEAGLADVSELAIGDTIEVDMKVDLGSLTIDDVAVELVIGNQHGEGDLVDHAVVPLELRSSEGSVHEFHGSFQVERSGVHGHGLRVRAGHEWVLWA